MKKENIIFINKSIAASLLISLGVYVLLKIGNPIGPILFSLGLLGVCYLKLNLFTGKCGFLFQDKLKIHKLVIMLLVNLISGYIFGIIFTFTGEDIVQAAISKVNSWDISLSFFIKSILCGVIMYIAVYMYKKNTCLGIIFGIPLFIFCGFQHCIANIITLGVARTFSWSIVICVIGNFLGSLFIWYLSKDMNETDVKLMNK